MRRRKNFVREIVPDVHLYRDPETGLAWVTECVHGTVLSHSCHPAIHEEELARQFKRSTWTRAHHLIRVGTTIYNVSICCSSADDPYKGMARRECCCGGNHFGKYFYILITGGARLKAGPFWTVSEMNVSLEKVTGIGRTVRLYVAAGGNDIAIVGADGRPLEGGYPCVPKEVASGN
jgi:hypothetical protein